jgi:hypothetical protein
MTLANGPKSEGANPGNGVLIFKGKDFKDTGKMKVVIVGTPLIYVTNWSPYYMDHSLFSDYPNFGK